jgi:hypothetical protein
VNFLFVKMRVRHLFLFTLQYDAADTQVSNGFFFHKNCVVFFLSMVFPRRQGKHFNDCGIFNFVNGAF